MSWSTSELRVRLAPLNRFKPSGKIFYWPFQGGTSFVDLLCFCSVLCVLFLCARLFICALWSPARKGLTSWLSFVVPNCEFLVSWVRCGSWLYRFLIFALLLTLLSSKLAQNWVVLWNSWWLNFLLLKDLLVVCLMTQLGAGKINLVWCRVHKKCTKIR